MDAGESNARVEAVRRFNRFYTRELGLLQDRLLASPFSLTEARVLYEIAHRGETTATHLGTDLRLDAGYLSRIIRRFEKRGLVRREPSGADRRQVLLSLTDSGRAAFTALNAASHREIDSKLRALSDPDGDRLVNALSTVEQLLGGARAERSSYVLRPHRNGDMGWVVERHGVLYWQEYGWDERFEALVAGVVADFILNLDVARERCWIAERDGERVGSVFLVRHPEREGVARLRLLLVEPEARGLGIGRRLVQECSRFAREAGYSRITLWTNSVLVAARQIYVSEGYQLVHEEPHHSFGHDLVGQTWELRL